MSTVTDTFLTSWSTLLEDTALTPLVLEQHVFSLDVNTDVREVCDHRDIAIAVLAGEGNLVLAQEVVDLTPGKFIFIPAYIPHCLKSSSSLVYLLSRYQADSANHNFAWIFDL